MAIDTIKQKRLREGHPVEFEPGVFGRVNPQYRTLELSSGEVIPIPPEDYLAYFPENEGQKRQIERQEEIQREVERLPFGETLFKMGEHSNVLQLFKNLGENFSKGWESISAKPGQENLSFFERLGENKANELAAYQGVSQQISENNPFSTAAGAALGIGADLLATRGMSGAKAGGVLTAAGESDKIFSDPAGFATDVATGTALGYGVDKAVQGLGRMADFRGSRRAARENIANIEAQNLAGKEATDIANAQGRYQTEVGRQQAMAYNAGEKARIDALNAANRQTIEDANFAAREAYASQKLHNEQVMQQYQAAKAARVREIFEIQQNYQQSRAARDEEVFRLKQEWDAAKAAKRSDEKMLKKQYEEAAQARRTDINRLEQEYQEAIRAHRQEVDLLPELEAQAQAEYSANTIGAVEKIAQSAGRDVRFTKGQLGVDDFLDSTLMTTERAGSPATREVSGFLKSIFKKAEQSPMTSEEIVKAYQAIEGRIARGNPEVKQILSEFKEFLGQRLPIAVADSKIAAKWMPKLQKNLMGIVEQLPYKQMGGSGFMADRMKSQVKQALEALTPQEFAQIVRNKELSSFVRDSILDVEAALPAHLKGKVTIKNANPELLQRLTDELERKASKLFRQIESDAFITNIDVQNKLRGKIAKTQGFAPEMVPPAAPAKPIYPEPPLRPQPLDEPLIPNLPGPIPAPELPPPVEMPNVQPIVPPAQSRFVPQEPALQQVPSRFVEQPFIPQSLPTVPEPQGLGERLAAGIEDFNPGDLLKSKGLTDNPLAKLAALKYVLGKGAVPVEAAAAGGMGLAKMLTSPTATGEISRTAFKQGMIGLIDSMAQRYPSYRNGILDSPLDRRSLVKEIEENSNMSLEDKAIYQAKVNRGEPLLPSK